MPHEIKETDWKLLRQLHPIALERFCHRILSEVESISTDSAKSFHQCYLDIYDFIQTRNEDIVRTFDNPRRSTALMQLAAIRAQDLLTGEEFQRLVKKLVRLSRFCLETAMPNYKELSMAGFSGRK